MTQPCPKCAELERKLALLENQAALPQEWKAKADGWRAVAEAVEARCAKIRKKTITECAAKVAWIARNDQSVTHTSFNHLLAAERVLLGALENECENTAIANGSAIVWTDEMLQENERLAESIHGKMKERIAAAQVTQHTTGKDESPPPASAAAHITPISKTPAQSLADQPCSASPTPLGQEIDNLRRQLAEERAAALAGAVAVQDAKRYRWLRDHNMVECPHCISNWKCNGPHITGGPELNVAIDAAIAAGDRPLVHPPTAHAAADMVLVPREPTVAMRIAGNQAAALAVNEYPDAALIWKAMLASAQKEKP